MVFYAIRDPNTKKFYRCVNHVWIPDVDLGGQNLSAISLFSTLKNVTDWEIATRGLVRHEVVELELRETRIIHPVIDVSSHEIPGDQLSVVGRI